MIDLENLSRKAEGKVDPIADKADAKVEPFLKKYGKWIAIGIAALGVLLLLTRGF